MPRRSVLVAGRSCICYPYSVNGIGYLRCFPAAMAVAIFLSVAGCSEDGKREWKLRFIRLTALTGASEEGYFLYGSDALAPPGRPVLLAAHLRHIDTNVRLEGVRLQFRRNGELLGERLTDDRGTAKLRWIPPGTGVYRVEVRIADVPEGFDREILTIQPVTLVVDTAGASRPVAVVDLDNTLVGGSFVKVLIGRGDPLADSLRVMRRLARTHTVVYLTHRPLELTHISRTWLEEHGYPRGVLILSTAEQAIGDAAAFKSRRLRELARTCPRLEVGIGDKLSDVEAYLASGLRTVWIVHPPDEAKGLRRLADQLDRYTGRDVTCAEDWAGVERALYENVSVTPAEFASELRRRAEQRKGLFEALLGG